MGHKLSKISLAVLSATSLNYASSIYAQDATNMQVEDEVEIIEVSAIRKSLTSALMEKRSSDKLVEIIQAEDIGKLPDQNLAEVLENVTGIQITREAGVGTGVQIRGTSANRTEINGVSTVGSGSGRGGISFEDLPAALISAVEVTKSPDAKTIEGSVGGTINLRTLRPLQLREQVAAVRIQAEDSDLSTDSGYLPRLSGTYGNNWELDAGKFGAVFSASYAKQDVTAFRPRVDRDNIVQATSVIDGRPLASAESFDYLAIQFLNQDYDNFEYETKNLAASFEWAPNNNTKLYLDAIYNDQERRQESTRVQLSGVGNIQVTDTANITAFETVNLGSLEGQNGNQNLGSIQAAAAGILYPTASSSGVLDPNLRGSSDTGARLTTSRIFRFGGEWEGDKLSASAEVSSSDSDSFSPNFSSTLDFINPNSAQPVLGQSIDNGVPIEFDLTGGSLTFGIAQGLATTPTSTQLLDPANYQLQQVQQGLDKQNNAEDAFRTDFSYDLADVDLVSSFLTSVDFGYRFNKTTSVNDDANKSNSFTNSTSAFNRPSADLFSSIIVAGPNNFDAADGRDLFIRDFLIINPELAFSDRDGVLAILNAAIAENNALTSGADIALLTAPTSLSNAYFSIEEKTHALYAQANFEKGIFRGNIGLRYVDTSLSSLGNTTVSGGEVSQVLTESSYNFLLPRANLVVDVSDDVIVRAGYAKDIRRPDFNDLSTSLTFATSPNAAVVAGNPDLLPEEVESFDLSVEWYFSPGSVLSAGVFYKDRTQLHVTQTENPPGNADPVTGQLNVDITAPCEEGGIYNPIADRNVLNPNTGVGICVPYSSTFNGAGSTTQSGIELAFQYNLSEFEKELGWASGFGLIANYTRQKFEGNDEYSTVEGGARDVFLKMGFNDLTFRNTLRDLSENAYNITVFYEKYDLSARLRYTWRDAYRSSDPGFFDLDLVNEARGQLNASLNYNINEQLNVGLDVINLTQSDAEQSCINEGALLCFQGLTDRRILLGANYRF